LPALVRKPAGGVIADAPILYGAGYSVYVRAVMMALDAKGVVYQHVPVDVFSNTGIPAYYLQLHPFGKIPAFQHGDFELYETVAINRYIDEAFEGPPLQPANAAMRARMTQLMCMTDSYGYRPLVWDIYVERISNPREGKSTDEARIAIALPAAKTYLHAIDQIAVMEPWLLGNTATLADSHVWLFYQDSRRATPAKTVSPFGKLVGSCFYGKTLE
jgi:glutathione S-transferase